MSILNALNEFFPNYFDNFFFLLASELYNLQFLELGKFETFCTMFSILSVSAQCTWCSSVFFHFFLRKCPDYSVWCRIFSFSRISSGILYILSVKVLRPRKHFARSNGPQVLRETNGRPNLFFFSLLGFSTDLPNAAVNYIRTQLGFLFGNFKSVLPLSFLNCQKNNSSCILPLYRKPYQSSI